MTLFDASGIWASELTYDAVPEAARRTVKRAAVDFLGVAAAGSRHDLAHRLHAYLDASHVGSGRSRLFGRAGRANPEGAAMFNSAVGHVLDFDDSSDTLLGHPTVVILPALLALADERPVSGRDLITAYAAGFEVAAHLARQINVAHYERGWHPTATIGVFAAAAAAARLLNLDAATSSAALAIASSFPAGLRAQFGTEMKPVQVGAASRNGVVAALLAEAGIGGGSDAFEHEQGFGAAYNGEDGFGSGAFDGSDDRPWDLVDPGLATKLYPCCASTHPAIDAAIDLRAEIPDPSAIDSVAVRLHPRRLRHTDNPDPQSPLEAKFSVQYAVATALGTGSVTLADFTARGLQASDELLLKRTTAEPFPPEEYGPGHFAGEVTVKLGDGQVLRRRVERARGRGGAPPVSDDEIDAKFMSCARPALGSDVASDLLETLAALEAVEDVSTVTEAMTRSQRA